MTAVEWLYSEYKKILGRSILEYQSVPMYLSDALEKAKEMEKEQIQDAWDSGFEEMPFKNGEQYYNETFKLE